MPERARNAFLKARGGGKWTEIIDHLPANIRESATFNFYQGRAGEQDRQSILTQLIDDQIWTASQKDKLDATISIARAAGESRLSSSSRKSIAPTRSPSSSSSSTSICSTSKASAKPTRRRPLKAMGGTKRAFSPSSPTSGTSSASYSASRMFIWLPASSLPMSTSTIWRTTVLCPRCSRATCIPPTSRARPSTAPRASSARSPAKRARSRSMWCASKSTTRAKSSSTYPTCCSTTSPWPERPPSPRRRSPARAYISRSNTPPRTTNPSPWKPALPS